MTLNVAASIHQRLLTRARHSGRPFNELLQYFTLERFLYRLGVSPYAQHFVLKGALMFTVWTGPSARSTRDIDLLGHLDNTPERMIEVMQAVCRQPVADEDGLQFQAEAVSARRITEAADYQGVRVTVPARLGLARVLVRVDIGFGDILVPRPSWVTLPAILDFPPARLRGYSRESVVAEKLQAMVYLGEINSRMKDFFDIWLLATGSSFQGPLLAKAIQATFARRRTPLLSEPVALTQAFAANPDKKQQWTAFVARHPNLAAPAKLETVVDVLAAFLLPVLAALIGNEPFDSYWLPEGPWQPGAPSPQEDQPT